MRSPSTWLRSIGAPTRLSISCSPILPPCPPHAGILLIYIQFYVSQSLGYSNAGIYPRVTCANDNNLQRTQILYWRIIEFEGRFRNAIGRAVGMNLWRVRRNVWYSRHIE